MKKFLHTLLPGISILLLLIGASCNMPAATPYIAEGTILANDTPMPATTLQVSPTATFTELTPLIPITGENVLALQCQFCVNETPHAVLIFPDVATFEVQQSTTPATCLTAQVVNGRRVLICQGPPSTTFLLNICSDGQNCLQYPVALQNCPLIPQTGLSTPVLTVTPVTPFFLPPINTLIPPTRTPIPTSTSILPSTPVPTLIVPTVTAIPPTIPVTTEPPPTIAPPPTTIETTPPPAPTDPAPTEPPPTDGDSSKPTKKPSKTPKR